MGLEYGSTKSRQAWNGAVRKVFFESPIVRLMKLGYNDIYQDGLQLETGRIAPESIVIHRYYDMADPDFGSGKVPTVEQAAQGNVARRREPVADRDPRHHGCRLHAYSDREAARGARHRRVAGSAHRSGDGRQLQSRR